MKIYLVVIQRPEEKTTFAAFQYEAEAKEYREEFLLVCEANGGASNGITAEVHEITLQ